MSKLFFDHLIKIERLEEQLVQLDVAEEEMRELREIVDGLIQQRVVEVILDVLHEDHHHVFISRMHLAPADPEILVWLKEQVADIEERITLAIQKLEDELLEELGRMGKG